MVRKTVVLVESDPDMEKMVQALAGQPDEADVILAENVDQAEVLVRDLLPALIIVDDDSPAHSGERLVQSFRATVETRDIPIVVLCSDSDRGRELVSQGAEAFLPKPFEASELGDLIQFYTQSVPPLPGGRPIG